MEIHQLASPIQGVSCHAWNSDRSMIAICPNNNEIHIYETKQWNRLHILAEHDLLVSGIDWSATTNKIVSCSHDRNAFVWTFDAETDTWKPALVILRIDRAALDVQWSSDGLRFAVTSGSKCVPVCTYEHANDWWVCKMIKKKFKSTVLCCAFHPTNGQLLATGCADFKCRVFSTFAADVDGTNVDCGPFAGGVGPVEFGESYVELTTHGWIHAVAWSPSGTSLAYAAHDSSVHIAQLDSGAEPVVKMIRLNQLPLCSLLFLSENSIIGAGHDFNPTAFTKNANGEWNFFCNIESAPKKSDTPTASSGVSAARELFKNKTSRGQESKSVGDLLTTTHERSIVTMKSAGVDPKNPKISTSSLDGKLVLWDLPSLDFDFSQLKI